MEKYGYIFMVTNPNTKKKYIGQNIATEFDESFIGLGEYVQKTMKKAGMEHNVVTLLEWGDSQVHLDEREGILLKEHSASCADKTDYSTRMCQKKYLKESMTAYTIRYRNDLDKDIIDFLESGIDTKANLIRMALKDYMKKLKRQARAEAKLQALEDSEEIS